MQEDGMDAKTCFRMQQEEFEVLEVSGSSYTVPTVPLSFAHYSRYIRNA